MTFLDGNIIEKEEIENGSKEAFELWGESRAEEYVLLGDKDDIM